MARVNFTTVEQQQQMEERLERQRKSRNEKIEKLLEYANSKYGCEFPQNFAERMTDLPHNKPVPSKKVVDALYVQWLIWKPYVNHESFKQFMKREIERMFKIQTTSTFGKDTLNEYIGNKAKLVQLPPETMSTTVYLTGVLKLNGREVKVSATE